MRKYIVLSLLIISGASCTQDGKTKIIAPDWEIGDSKYYERHFSYLIISDSDTITNASAHRLLKLSVTYSDDEYYNLKVENASNNDFEFRSSIDTIEDKFDRAFEIINQIAVNYVPFEVQISRTGEFLGVVDFEQYYAEVLEVAIAMADTFELSTSEYEFLSDIFDSQFADSGAQNSEILWDEISELLNIYNIEDPSEATFSEDTYFPHPSTGELLRAIINYDLVEETDLHKVIAMETKIIPNTLYELTESDSVSENTKKIDDALRNFANKGYYYLNKKTSWVDSIYQYYDLQTDNITVSYRSNERTY